jgi:transaldolase/glucose-6-phosphate isomerase
MVGGSGPAATPAATGAAVNPLRRLHDLGQSPWLDYIHRRSLEDGSFERLVREDGIRGVTSNPTIFEQAIAGSDTYDGPLAELVAARPRQPVDLLYQQLAVADIRRAADLLRPVFDESSGGDGFVSLEVAPDLAYDTEGTIAQAERLWEEVARPNLMVKVPATAEGIPAIEELTARGVNVNVTLMFSLADYDAVAEAYLRGLERVGDRERLGRIASVASFFVSRIDGKVDPLLERHRDPAARELLGTIAIANAKLAYRRFRQVVGGTRFAALAARGARSQRVLWGSTSTKNPAYPDVLYVEELIGPDTVNTLPLATVAAYRDHGDPAVRVTAGWDEAEARLARLEELGIDLAAITAELQREGVGAFARSFDQLHSALEGKRRSLLARRARGAQRVALGPALGPVTARLRQLQERGFAHRLGAADRSLWSPGPVPELVDRLGWLHLPRSAAEGLDTLLGLAREVRDEGFRQVVVLGMGGSSLAPEVFARVFGPQPGWPALAVLDSTHPAAVAELEAGLDLARTLFVVSSKSGTTVETLSLYRYFRARLEEAGCAAGRHLVAITDPGSPLEREGREGGFRAVVTAPPEVGGRYSALTPFGLLPAALAGLDVAGLLDRALGLAEAFAVDPELVSEPVVLGAVLGELARAARDKVTFVTTPGLAAFPLWLEQLLAESTGKDGTGLVPVVEPHRRPAAAYGADRVLVALTLAREETAELAAWWQELEVAGQPLVRIALGDRLDLGREMLRFELATAVAGAVLGVQPFDQPDVQLAKELARRALDEEAEAPSAVTVEDPVLGGALAAWLAGEAPAGYLGVHAYLAPGAAIDEVLGALATALAERTGAAVTVGYGPRFLHSTGQLHKGGPAGARFLQLVDRPAEDRRIPGGATFGQLIAAQARGDRAALLQRGQRVLTVDLGRDPAAALAALTAAIGRRGGG